MGNLEQEAIRRILAGDRDAFRVLMDRHLPTVLRMTYRVTGNADDAEDVLQTVFLRMVKRDTGAEPVGNMASFLHRAAVNAAGLRPRGAIAATARPRDSANRDIADSKDVNHRPNKLGNTTATIPRIAAAIRENSSTRNVRNT